jgi:predicted Zn-dependent protease
MSMPFCAVVFCGNINVLYMHYFFMHGIGFDFDCYFNHLINQKQSIMKKIMGTLALASLLMVSCKKTNDEVVTTEEVSSEIRGLVKAAGFNSNWVKPDGDGYLIEGDMYVTKAQLQQLSTSNEGANLIVARNEHYRTFNLVGGLPRTLKVRLDIAGTKFSQALNIALARYNNENLALHFQRVTSGPADIVIFSTNTPPNPDGSINLGRSNGFPLNGNPATGFSLNINEAAYGNPNVSTNLLATTMAHEIGHTIGMRHTDYFNRAFSCNGNQGYDFSEAVDIVGAVYIPGTPFFNNQDNTSWMLACSNGTDRPFNYNDKVALNYIY